MTQRVSLIKLLMCHNRHLQRPVTEKQDLSVQLIQVGSRIIRPLWIVPCIKILLWWD